MGGKLSGIYVSLGVIVGEAYEFSHRYRLFHPFVVDRSVTTTTALTADDLMFNVPSVGPGFPIPLRELSHVEKEERFLLWTSMMTIDTYASFVGGYNFNVDEFRFPHLLQRVKVN